MNDKQMEDHSLSKSLFGSCLSNKANKSLKTNKQSKASHFTVSGNGNTLGCHLGGLLLALHPGHFS